jgi:hypothetical protein
MFIVYYNYRRKSSILTLWCVRISRLLHTRYGWFWGNFTWWYFWWVFVLEGSYCFISFPFTHLVFMFPYLSYPIPFHILPPSSDFPSVISILGRVSIALWTTSFIFTCSRSNYRIIKMSFRT